MVTFALYNREKTKGIQKMANHYHDPATYHFPNVQVSGHFSKAFGYETVRSEGTRDWLLTYTLKGKGGFQIGDVDFMCQSGDIIILKPGTPHHYYTRREEVWDFLWVHFIPRLDWKPWLQLPERDTGLLSIHANQPALQNRLTTAFFRLIEDNQPFNRISRELALNALEEIILLIYQKSNPSYNHIRDPRIQDIVEYLTHHYNQHHSIAELAKMACLSPSRLAHLFKQEVGQSIIEMLITIRLKHATRFLQFTSHSITEIAEECGFQSTSYFSQQFSRVYGISPTSYRAQTARN